MLNKRAEGQYFQAIANLANLPFPNISELTLRMYLSDNISMAMHGPTELLKVIKYHAEGKD